MVMLPGKARRMSPRASTWILASETEVPAPRGSPGRRRGVGLWVEAMPTLCTTRCKIPFRMSWRNVVCAARDGNRIPWSTSAGRRGTPQLHCRSGALECSMLKLRRWRRLVRTTQLLTSRALVKGSVSSHAEAGRHAQLSKQVLALCPSVMLASKDPRWLSARVCALCREKLRCAAAIVSRLLGLTSWYSGGHRVPARPSREAHWVQSCTPLGSSNDRKVSGPLSMVSLWVVAAAAR
jgi:hypothetical protein